MESGLTRHHLGWFVIYPDIIVVINVISCWNAETNLKTCWRLRVSFIVV
jgi:hypothetical protein